MRPPAYLSRAKYHPPVCPRERVNVRELVISGLAILGALLWMFGVAFAETRTKPSGVEGHATEPGPSFSVCSGSCSTSLSEARAGQAAGIKPGLGFVRASVVSSGAASKRVVMLQVPCASEGCGAWAARANLTDRLPRVRLGAGPRPALAGWGATAAGASPPESRQCETASSAGLESRQRRQENASGQSPTAENGVTAGRDRPYRARF